jgi:hypothetical protein
MARGSAVFKVPSERISAAGKANRQISAQDETLRGGGVAFEISVDHGDGLLSAKRGIHIRDSGMSRQSLDVAKLWLLLEFKPRRAGIVTHLSQAVG